MSEDLVQATSETDLSPNGQLHAAMYLVWSNEHGAWWRPNSCGYTRSFEAAGRYPREDAIAICALARDGWDGKRPPSEIPVAETDALECAQMFTARFASPRRSGDRPVSPPYGDQREPS